MSQLPSTIPYETIVDLTLVSLAYVRVRERHGARSDAIIHMHHATTMLVGIPEYCTSRRADLEKRAALQVASPAENSPSSSAPPKPTATKSGASPTAAGRSPSPTFLGAVSNKVRHETVNTDIHPLPNPPSDRKRTAAQAWSAERWAQLGRKRARLASRHSRN